MSYDLPLIRARIATLRERLDGRAVGVWSVEGSGLVLQAFGHAPDMPTFIVRDFTSATREVDLARLDLGIVRAVVENRYVVSLSADLPPDRGSGYWLRAFGAGRSVAVSMDVYRGAPLGVVSIALAATGPIDEEAVVEIRRATFGWFFRAQF